MRLIISLLMVLVSSASTSLLAVEGKCGEGYKKCVPKGTSDGFENVVYLYQNLVDSVAVASSTRSMTLERAFLERSPVAPLCCVESMQCLLLNADRVPFCWDRFTTNVYFADGWYGSIATGNFTTPSGAQVNLITGEYADGSGNIYPADAGAKPNTATMNLPTPWTSKGVGSAIPASVLGAPATYTVTIPGTTRDQSTIPAETIPATTIAGTAVPATTKPVSTIYGTTVPARATTVTKGPVASHTHLGTAAHAVSQLVNALLTTNVVIIFSLL